jgi:cardiolipin synthase
MRHIPNALTIARILFTPFIGLALARNQLRAAVIMLFVAGISDGFDGYLARRFQWSSRLGSLLDPIADKFMMATAFVGLGLNQSLPWWLVWLVLGRDLMILSFAAFAFLFTKIRALPPSIYGKISTMLQMLLAGDVVLNGAWPGALPFFLQGILFWATAAATSISGLHYVYTSVALLRAQPD